MLTSFEVLFPVMMIGMPALIVRCTAVRAGSVPQEAATKARRLYGLTVVALLVHGAALWVLGGSEEAPPSAFSLWTQGFSMFAFFWLWFGFAGPAMAARDPGWQTVHTKDKPERSASLSPRHLDSSAMLPRAAWTVGWCLYAISLTITIWSVTEGLHASVLASVTWWPSFAWGARAVRSEAEPRDAGGSAELARAYANHRRFRAWGFYGLGLAGSVGMAVAFAMAVLAPESNAMVGGIGGSVLGLGGAGFGAMAAFRGAKVNGLLRQLGCEDGS
ncbi:MAG: hypothetical protein ACI9EF_001516 [Pseudohongiellaceae bacterium]|jgi:hypothetical protein